MTRNEMITVISEEIDRLERVRALLEQSNSDKFSLTGKLMRGATAQLARDAAAKESKRTLSPEARKRIAQAQKRRWAKQKTGRG